MGCCGESGGASDTVACGGASSSGLTSGRGAATSVLVGSDVPDSWLGWYILPSSRSEAWSRRKVASGSILLKKAEKIPGSENGASTLMGLDRIEGSCGAATAGVEAGSEWCPVARGAQLMSASRGTGGRRSRGG